MTKITINEQEVDGSAAEAVTSPPAPYALIILTDNLRVAKFQTKDEWLIAAQNLRAQNSPFIPLKYHGSVQAYSQQEIWT